MKKYEIINQINGVVYGIYDDQEKAKKDYEAYLELTDDTNQSLVIVELPEVEDPELDYQRIDCLINEMLDCMEQICKLANLEHISLSYIITKLDGVGAFMSAWSGEKYGTTYIGDRTNIFSKIHKQIKGGSKNV